MISLKPLLYEHSLKKVYIFGVRFNIIVNLDNNIFTISYLPLNAIELEKLNKNRNQLIKRIKDTLTKKMQIDFHYNADNAGISFETSISNLEELILVLFK